MQMTYFEYIKNLRPYKFLLNFWNYKKSYENAVKADNIEKFLLDGEKLPTVEETTCSKESLLTLQEPKKQQVVCQVPPKADNLTNTPAVTVKRAYPLPDQDNISMEGNHLKSILKRQNLKQKRKDVKFNQTVVIATYQNRRVDDGCYWSVIKRKKIM